MASVEFRAASRTYPGTDRPAVADLSLNVWDGEFMVVVGPTGCGKSTALRMLAGLEPVDEGSIRIGHNDVTSLPPKERDIAMVFQNYALYPHMTVAENMAFNLRVAGRGDDEVRSRVVEAARMLELEPFLDRKPAHLSGGQRQRVAMGRAIVRRPRVFCMDEPLSSLDAKLRLRTRGEIASLQRRLGVTTVYITHDQAEAITMGDRVAILRDGVLQQCDTPRQVFDRPANTFVAGFIGAPGMNLFPLREEFGRIRFGATEISMSPAQRAAATSAEITIGVRPEGLVIVPPHQGLPATVQFVEELGNDCHVYVDTSVDTAEPVVVRVSRWHIPGKDTRVGLAVHREDIQLFDTLTGVRLPG